MIFRTMNKMKIKSFWMIVRAVNDAVCICVKSIHFRYCHDIGLLQMVNLVSGYILSSHHELKKKHHWLSPLYILEEIWWKRIYVLVLWGKLGMKWEMVPHYVTQASWDVSRKSWANSFYHGKVSGFCFITFPFCFIVPVEKDGFIYSFFVLLLFVY